MLKSSASKIRITGADKLLGIDKEMGQFSHLHESDLREFKDHPFKVREDDDMKQLMESIRAEGILVPIIVRPSTDGGYEIISGHRRVYAARRVGLSDIPVFIRDDITDDEAVIAMVDSNLQRKKLLPSEKARSYALKYNAIKNKDTKGDSLSEMCRLTGESRSAVQRMIVLATLPDTILEMVDAKKIGVVPAVNLSGLKKKELSQVEKILENQNIKITLDKSERLKALSLSGDFSYDEAMSILADKEASGKPEEWKVSLPLRAKAFFDKESDEEIADIIIALLEKWRGGDDPAYRKK